MNYLLISLGNGRSRESNTSGSQTNVRGREYILKIPSLSVFSVCQHLFFRRSSLPVSLNPGVSRRGPTTHSWPCHRYMSPAFSNRHRKQAKPMRTPLEMRSVDEEKEARSSFSNVKLKNSSWSFCGRTPAIWKGGGYRERERDIISVWPLDLAVCVDRSSLTCLHVPINCHSV